MAEHYAGVFDKTWRAVCENPRAFGPTTEVDAMVNDNLLRAAEVHLKLASIKRLHQMTGAKPEPPQRAYPFWDGEHHVLGPETFTDRDAEVIAYKGDNYRRAE